MIIKKVEDRERYIRASNLATNLLYELSRMLKPGVFPIDIDKKAFELCNKNKVKPAFYGAEQGRKPFKYNICISVNNEILHGVPSSIRKLAVGDIVKLDFGIIYQGLYTDQCFTFVVKEFLNQEDEILVLSAKMSVENALSKVKKGTKISEITRELASVNDPKLLQTKNITASTIPLFTLPNFVGHGIGKTLWESPSIPAVENTNHTDNLGDYELEIGEVICIESQVVQNSPEYYLDNQDNWTVKAKDNRNKSAMFEYMIITELDSYYILSDMRSWDIIIP